METIHSALDFEETPVIPKKEFVSSVDKETSEGLMAHDDEPGYFFRGAVIGIILCLPFWAIIYWLIA